MGNITQKWKISSQKNRTFYLKMKFFPNFSLGFDFVKLVNLISQIPNQLFMNLEMHHLSG
jgi:hypothetical protein